MTTASVLQTVGKRFDARAVPLLYLTPNRNLDRKLKDLEFTGKVGNERSIFFLLVIMAALYIRLKGTGEL